MPSKRGKCSEKMCDDFGTEVIIDSESPFVCTSCERELEALDRAEGKSQAPIKRGLGGGRNPTRAKITLALLAVFAVGSVWGLFRWIQGDPRIQVATTLQLPSTVLKQQRNHSLTIKNIGTGKLKITNITTPTEVAATPKLLIIPAGESREFDLAFTAGSLGEDKTLELVFSSNDSTQPKAKTILNVSVVQHDAQWLWTELEKDSRVLNP
jgi:hypothetical protein